MYSQFSEKLFKFKLSHNEHTTRVKSLHCTIRVENKDPHFDVHNATTYKITDNINIIFSHGVLYNPAQFKNV